ncbi:hypothetical protein ACOME3_004561 [Neoechinorhynchus agilis]
MLYKSPSVQGKTLPWNVATPKAFVKSAINSIGSQGVTSGWFNHLVYNEILFPLFPRRYVINMYRKTMELQQKAEKGLRLNKDVDAIYFDVKNNQCFLINPNNL